MTAAAVVAMACAPKPASTPIPEPSAGNATPAACPDATDTPQIIAYTVGVGYRAFRKNPSSVLPSCFVEAVGSKPTAYDDSIASMTLDMSDTLYARRPDDAANLAGRVPLLTRMTRYREVPATFDRLVRVDSSRATLANYRLALAAAMRGNDSTARLRYLTAAARKFPNATSIVADYNIQRQVPRLRALIDSSHQVLRLSPQRIERYATLASVYGNLDMPDSAIYYARRALSAGVPRNDVAPSLQSLAGVTMRKAQLLDAPEVWLRTLDVAQRIDQALSTDASKHLLALSMVEVADYYVNLAMYSLGGTAAELAVNARPLADAPTRAKSCDALRTIVPQMLDAATRALDQGGARFSTESVPAIQSGISLVRADRADILARCK
jgi:hypothetical protein